MRTRFKELLAQSGISTFPKGEEEVCLSATDLEKFAELIVQECVELFSDDLSPMWDFTGKACRYMIKEHFGIEK